MNYKPSRRPVRALSVLAVALGSAVLLPLSRAAPDPPAAPAKPPTPAGHAAPAPPAPEEPIRFGRNVPGDSQPLLLNADEFATWIERGRRIILMKGQVLLQQGLVRVRCREAVVVVDLARLQRTSIMHADVYAEGEVRLEDGRSDQKGSRAILDLNTRGELKIHSQYKKVLQSPVTDAPLFGRAVSALYAPVGPAVIIPAKAEKPAPPAPAPTPPMPPPAPTAPAPPPGFGPPPSSVRSSGRDLDGDGVTQVSAKTVPAQRSGPATPAGPGAAPGPRLLQPPPGGEGPMRQYSVAPRTGASFQLKSETLPSGEQASIFTGGVIVSVRAVDGSDLIDIEADNALVWSRGGLTREMIENLRGQGQSSRELEFYFSGNVEIRQQTAEGSRLLKADEIYLDAGRNVAIAAGAELIMWRKGVKQPIHLRADELKQLSPTKFDAINATVFSSKLPSDPGVKVVLAHAVLEEVRVPRTTLFGQPSVDSKGNPVEELQRPIKGERALLELEDVPIFYLPSFQGDATHPFGPLESIRLGGNRIFGFETGFTLDVYDLFHLQPVPGSRWRAEVDYLSKRGPALGTTYDGASPTFFGIPARVNTQVKAYGIYDTGTDILGGDRGPNDNHPDLRGRLLVRENVQQLPEGFAFQSQIGAFSDRNFLEQYFKNEYDTDCDRTTYLYLKQTLGSFAWTGYASTHIRNWVTETEWLPRLDGYLIGYDLFDMVSYSASASAGFAELRTSHDPTPPVSPTDVRDSTWRFDLRQEASIPFYLGPVKLAPYAVADLAYYTNDLTGNDDGRAWGGGGLRASMPLTRLYPDVHSLLWNLNGINHKIVLSGNYLYAGSTTPYSRFPQLDRLNDEVSDQALRDIRPILPTLNPANGFFLVNSKLYDPQVYAIRRLVDNRIDTLDDIQVVQLDIRQRLQTKRGFPGQEHIIDWMTLDVSASLFPASKRDNFDSTLSFLEYDYLWNIGDRTALVSSGWIDPADHGVRVFTIGSFLERPDRTTFYLGYRQINQLESKAVTAAVTYVFSPKYAMTGSTTYDFGTQQTLSNSVVFTRLGSDLNVGLGFTYNALQNNFGVLFEITPTLMQGRGRGFGSNGGFVNR